MGMKISGALPPVAFDFIQDGDVFVVTDGGGHMVCVGGSTDDYKFAIVLGSKGTAYDEHGAGWVMGTSVPEPIYRLEEATIEPIPGPLGFPIPADSATNGTLTVDSDGTPWLYAVTTGERRYFNLKTGKMGKPVGTRTNYNAWRVTWRPSDDPKVAAVKLLEFPTAAQKLAALA